MAALMRSRLPSLLPSLPLSQNFSTTNSLQHIIKLTRLRVVDNSMLGNQSVVAGKPPRCIHVYNKTGVGRVGDKVLVAIMGQKKRAFIVGVKQRARPNKPRFDSNNIVLVEDNGAPTGTRIRVPVPSDMRAMEGDVTKILALATKFA
ncbi:hypothetical protein CAPTEDRAFT_18027 [Capitella teleta]|uniref:Large ribosomal subunit protein uL14m n=1 Tax=Capitella teleta TaxID=283909 RepID=R7U059_CAPTE|nr:hypothetical protein CAPTEDRAFT_18027 [Capitella teleta]|eukprot:ELT96590.1 hypothetical protein CAPTEDRAFT_18027 [Capitella teleta]